VPRDPSEATASHHRGNPVKTIGIEQASLEACVDDARHERVVVTRNGAPVALIVGIEGMDEDQVSLGASDEFWKLIAERRQQRTVSRAELERGIGDEP
jgi:antitoxin (DNA-binding transcriptional repressor) of toxin-antitoxin stability system